MSKLYITDEPDEPVTEIVFSTLESSARASQINIRYAHDGDRDVIRFEDHNGCPEERVRVEDIPKLIRALQKVLELKGTN